MLEERDGSKRIRRHRCEGHDVPKGTKERKKDAAKTNETKARRARACLLEPAGPWAWIKCDATFLKPLDFFKLSRETASVMTSTMPVEAPVGTIE